MWIVSSQDFHNCNYYIATNADVECLIYNIFLLLSRESKPIHLSQNPYPFQNTHFQLQFLEVIHSHKLFHLLSSDLAVK